MDARSWRSVFSVTVLVDRPISKGRPRLGKGGHAFTPKRTRDAEKHLAGEIREWWPKPPLEGPIYAEFEFSFRRPKSGPNATAAHHSSRPDLDNLEKLALDACTMAGLWVDDAQVCECRSRKRWCDDGANPTVRIVVWTTVDT